MAHTSPETPVIGSRLATSGAGASLPPPPVIRAGGAHNGKRGFVSPAARDAGGR